MLEVLVIVTLLAVLGCLVLLVLQRGRAATPDLSALDARFVELREETRRVESALRDETARSLSTLRTDLTAQLAQFQIAAEQLGQASRSEARAQAGEFQLKFTDRLEAARVAQNHQLNEFATRLADFGKTTREELERVRQTLDAKLTALSTQNAQKLDEMRATVDQRLQATLEQRLGESFKVVSDNLARVTQALGEMQQIATGVGDLKRVLTNVKTRGTWGEVQLAALLEQVLTRDQYELNVAPIPGSSARVEFAIRLPGQGDEAPQVWLPLDAKFPIEDYQRLTDAADRADAEAVAAASAALATRVREFAKTIAEKYIAPPHTTDFALLYLPTEGLYAEVLRQPGLVEQLQRQHRVVLVGPTTLAALLNSLQMGFRTLAIQKRSSEVWTVLGAVKTEFGKFGEVLDKVKSRLEAATKEIDNTGVRSRAIERQLRKVEALTPDQASQVLPGLAAPEQEP